MIDPDKIELLPFQIVTPALSLQDWVIGALAVDMLVANASNLFELTKRFRKRYVKKQKEIENKTLELILNALVSIALASYIGSRDEFDQDAQAQEILEKWQSEMENDIRAWFSLLGFVSSGQIGNSGSNAGKPPRQPFNIWNYYNMKMTEAIAGLHTIEREGADVYETVRNTVREMSNSGIHTLRFPSHTDKIDVAVRRSLMKGISEANKEYEALRAKQLGVTTFEITYHEGHRESHGWGGRRFTTEPIKDIDPQTGIRYMLREELFESFGGGTLEDWNCRHSAFAIKPTDEPRFTTKELSRLEARTIEKRTYGGKEYTLYEAKQRQREYERKMRELRSRALGFKSAGMENDYKETRILYYSFRREYTRFSEAMDLHVEFERVYYDNLGRI